MLIAGRVNRSDMTITFVVDSYGIPVPVSDDGTAFAVEGVLRDAVDADPTGSAAMHLLASDALYAAVLRPHAPASSMLGVDRDDDVFVAQRGAVGDEQPVHADWGGRTEPRRGREPEFEGAEDGGTAGAATVGLGGGCC